MRLHVGQVVRTPFEPSGLVQVVALSGPHPVNGRLTVEVRYLEEHPHGYRAGTLGCYFRDELRPARPPRLLVPLVAWLLHHANAHPPMHQRERFYHLKDRLLKRYGRRTGTDLQHIVKACWDGPCPRCHHTGVWEESYITLERWQLGRYPFHRPLERLAAPRGPVTIEGYISHPGHSLRTSRECALWLALLFDRTLLWRLLTHTVSLGWTLAPLLALKQAGWAMARAWHRVGLRRCHECHGLFLALGRPAWSLRCPACEQKHALALTANADDLPF